MKLRQRTAPTRSSREPASEQTAQKSGGQVRIAPIVARQIDPELLKKMGVVAEGHL